MISTEQPSTEVIAAYRREKFCLDPALAITTLEQAEALVARCGLALLTGSKGVALPSLTDAINGGPWEWTGWDDVIDRAWNWRSVIAERGQIAVGKFIKDRLCFAAPDTLEALYVLAAQDGRSSDGAPAADRVGREALRIYYVLLEQANSAEDVGMGVKALRKATGMEKPEASNAFNRGLLELQRNCYVTAWGAIDEGSRWLSNRFRVLTHAFPELAGAERHMDAADARAILVERYLDTAGFADSKQISAALGLPRPAVAQALESLSPTNRIVVDEKRGVAWTRKLIGS